MNVKTNAEKEWLRKMEGGIPRHQAEDVAPARAAAAKKRILQRLTRAVVSKTWQGWMNLSSW